MRRFLLAIGGTGFLLFAAAFLVSWLDPLLVERAAREVVRIEVERRVGERIESLADSKVAKLGQRALGRTEEDLAQAKRQLASGVPSQVSLVVAAMLDRDCACRKGLVERAREFDQERVVSLEQVRDRLASLVESAYANVTRQLMREFRIFTGANALAFAALIAVTWFRRAAALQLVLPAVVLIGAAGLTAALYLFSQNWLHTVVFGDYVGLAYLGYLALATGFLGDVVFNRARVSTTLVNLAAQAVGSAGAAVPC